MTRTTLLVLAALALLAALPAAAAPAPAHVAAAPAMPSCGQASLPFALPAALAPAASAATASAHSLPAWLAGPRAAGASDFQGFCHCGCSEEPDCNTDDDCSGGHCNEYRSCC